MKTLIILGFFTISLSLFSQTNVEILKKANDYIADKKYSSAFKTLNQYDPENSKPEIVLLKERIVLDYFVTSMMHRFFALKDLQPNEDIMMYRGQKGTFEMFSFSVDSILSKLIKIYPNDCKLRKGLADYYFDVDSKYPKGWFISKNEILDLMEKNYKAVIEDSCADYHSYYALGYINISKKKYKEGIPYFIKSIEFNKTFPSSYYNLAYAYIYCNDRPNALINAKIALDLYQDKMYKADAANMIATIYSELKDDNNSIQYFETGNEISPNNYYTLRPLLNLYFKTSSPKKEQTRELFYNLGPDKPTIYNDLSIIYKTNNQSDDLIKFYNAKLSKYQTEYKIIGSLDFYLGKLYFENQQNKDAKEYFLKAKENLSKVLSSDNQVFDQIDKTLKEIKE
jgi:tetratricopeptide (TPR) repeat protein